MDGWNIKRINTTDIKVKPMVLRNRMILKAE